MKNKTIALIPARGGSKELPGKNIRDFCGKPLLAWSIEAALNCQQTDAVYVSTDSEDIAKIAEDYGAIVPFLRPAEYSGDLATTESAMLHFCDFMTSQNKDFDNLLLLQATSPIRKNDTLDNALETFEIERADSLLSVSESMRFFWKKNIEAQALYDYANRPRRQDIAQQDKWYMETGSFYITKKQALQKSRNRLSGKIAFFLTSEKESYEIDSLLDFKICETIMRHVLSEEEL